jgi:hypothetical protein
VAFMLVHFFVCWNSNSSLNSFVGILFKSKPKPQMPKPSTLLYLILHHPAHQAAAAQPVQPCQPSNPRSAAARSSQPAQQPRSPARLAASTRATAQRRTRPSWPSGPSHCRPALPRPVPLTGGTPCHPFRRARPRPGLDRATVVRVRPEHASSAWPARQGVHPGLFKAAAAPGRPTRDPRALTA